MKMTAKERLERRHFRVRNKVSGTAERPRLLVRKSLKHLYAQVIDDSNKAGSRTLATFTTSSKATAGKHMSNAECAKALGVTVGRQLAALGITTVVFDRGGYKYHGVVKALADSVREAGIKF